jgi:hypothetical protein
MLNVSLNPRLLIGGLGLISLLLIASAGLLPFPAVFSLSQSNTIAPAATTAIDRAVSSARTRISDFATTDPKAFSAVLQQSFGDKLDANSGQVLTQQAARSQLPFARHTVFVPAHILEGASGAYAAEDGGLILLDETLRDKPAVLSEVILHEWAHHLDATLGPVDAVGEEGDVFVMGLRHSRPIATDELYRLRHSEGGHTTIQFRGVEMAIELFWPDWLNPIKILETVLKPLAPILKPLAPILKPLAAPFVFTGELAKNPVKTAVKVGTALGKTLENVGGTIGKMGWGIVKVAGSLAVGDYKGALNSTLNVATGPGNLLNKTATAVNEVSPGLGTAGNIALGFTPAGALAAGAQGLADTVNGFKNGGLKGGFTALAFAGLDVGMTKIGSLNKGLNALDAPRKKALDGLANALQPKPATWVGKSWAGIKGTPDNIRNVLKKNRLTRATTKEKGRAQTLLGPGKENTRKVVEILGKKPVKYGINSGIKGNIAGRDRDKEGKLLGTGGSSNDNTIGDIKDTLGTGGGDTTPPGADDTCPNDLSQREMIDVQRELSRLGFEPGPADGMAGAKTMEAIKTFQEGCRCLDSLPPGCVSEELLATVKATSITCDDSDRCALRLETLTGDFSWFFDAFRPIIHEDPAPISVTVNPGHVVDNPVTLVPGERATLTLDEACTAELGDLSCCEAEYEKSIALCEAPGESQPGEQRCNKSAINDDYNDCINAAQRRKAGTGVYTEQPLKPLQGRASGGGAGVPGSTAPPEEH